MLCNLICAESLATFPSRGAEVSVEIQQAKVRSRLSSLLQVTLIHGLSSLRLTCLYAREANTYVLNSRANISIGVRSCNRITCALHPIHSAVRFIGCGRKILASERADFMSATE